MRTMAMLIAATACIAAGGCAVNQASIEGHDLIDTVAGNLAIGIEEYHADDRERMRDVRRRLTGGFVADVVTAGSDTAAVKAVTNQFLAALDKAELAEDVEETRYSRLAGTLRALKEVNASLRDLAVIKLGWRDDVVIYTNRLRSKLAAAK